MCNDYYYLDIVSKKYLFFPFPEIKQKESHRQKSGSTKFCNFFYKRRDTKIDKMRPCAVRPKSCQELFSQAFLWRRPCLYSDPKSLGRISSVRIPTLILLRHAENHVYVYRLTFLESTILLCLTFSEIFAIFATLDCAFKNAKF